MRKGNLFSLSPYRQLLPLPQPLPLLPLFLVHNSGSPAATGSNPVGSHQVTTGSLIVRYTAAGRNVILIPCQPCLSLSLLPLSGTASRDKGTLAENITGKGKRNAVYVQNALSLPLVLSAGLRSSSAASLWTLRDGNEQRREIPAREREEPVPSRERQFGKERA